LVCANPTFEQMARHWFVRKRAMNVHMKS
jgi:hypothetical protein